MRLELIVVFVLVIIYLVVDFVRYRILNRLQEVAMPDTIMVSVLVRASWTPDLDGDVQYPTIEDYATRVRQQFDNDPLGALAKLPDAKVVEFAIDTH